MENNKFNQNSIIEPTEEELKIYKSFIKELDDEQLDELSSEYFELVSEEKINVSFPRYLIDKFIRPIEKGDTIAMDTEEGDKVILFCLMRQPIYYEEQKEEVTYLVFCKVDEETETLYHDEVYLFFVDGVDDAGTEVIDIISGEDATEIITQLEEFIDD